MTTVLVADDESSIRQVLRRYLTKRGFEVVEAGDGLQAQRVMEERAVDLAFVDFLMPRMDGIEFIKWAKLKYPETRIVALTGFDKSVNPPKPAMDPFTVIRKPFTLEEIADIVDRLDAD